MKAHLNPPKEMKKAIDEYTGKKIDEIQAEVKKEVAKERVDIATRATYMCLLACYQAGLSKRTLKRIFKIMNGQVLDKYMEYKTEKLADMWAHIFLNDIGVDVRETTEKL